MHGEGVWVHDERITALSYGVENIQWLSLDDGFRSKEESQDGLPNQPETKLEQG